MAPVSSLLFAVFLNLLCMSVFAGVPLSKRRAGMEELKFNDINQRSILIAGHRVKRQDTENLNEGSLPAEKQLDTAADVAQPNDKSLDTGSLTTDVPKVLPAITETDQSIPKTGAPEITKSGLNTDQAPDLAHSTTTLETSSTGKPTSPAPVEDDKDVSHLGTTAPGLTESAIDKNTTSDTKLINPVTEHQVTSESPGLELDVTEAPINYPTSAPGVNPSLNTTTQSVTATIPPQPNSSTAVPKLGELKLTEMTDTTSTAVPIVDDKATTTVPIVDDKATTTVPIVDDMPSLNTTTTNIGLVPLQEEKSMNTTLSPTSTSRPSAADIDITEHAVVDTSTPQSNETGVSLEAPPPPSQNTTTPPTTVETNVTTADSMTAVTTTSQSTVIIPVDLEASENTTSAAEDITTLTNIPEEKTNETTTPLDIVDSDTTNATTLATIVPTESILINATTETMDVILPMNALLLKSEVDSNLTTVVSDVLNITTVETTIATNATIIPVLPDVTESNDTTEEIAITNTTQAMSTLVDDIGTNSTEEMRPTTPVILVNATDSNITTTFPVSNETESLPDNSTVAMVTDILENDTTLNATTTTPSFLTENQTVASELNVTESYDISSTENVTSSSPMNATISSDEQVNVTNATIVDATTEDAMTTDNVTNTTTPTPLPKETIVVSINLTTVEVVPTMSGPPNTTTIAPSTAALPDTKTTTSMSEEPTNTSAAVGQSEGLSASALTAIITGSIIGFWIILGPIICLVCKVRDKRKERYHMRLSSQSDPPADNGMLDAMIISELKKTSESSHDNGTTKEKEYNTVVNDKAETERLQPKTAEHEF